MGSYYCEELHRTVPDIFLTFGLKYDAACRLLEDGDWLAAEEILQELLNLNPQREYAALLENDIGVLKLLADDPVSAIDRFRRAGELDSTLSISRLNLDWVRSRNRVPKINGEATSNAVASHSASSSRKVRIALLSLLFNWPSTGGGTIHTAETGYFLQEFGYEVRHWYAKYPEWGLGNVTEEPLLAMTEAVEFDAASWSREEIIHRFRVALDGFAPDYVIITDSWNSKPLLAEAARGYKFFLRLAAQECLCPLNNVRLLVDEQGRANACPKQQLATPNDCRRCVVSNERHSGWLHHHERMLAGFGTDEYDRRLRAAFSEAEGVLVVNPIIAAHIAPFAKDVHVVPSGFDARRFPWDEGNNDEVAGPTQLFFAGLVKEYMKGFHILLAACHALWAHRQDFEVVVTADVADGPDAPFLRYIGWQSQADLPRKMREAAIVVFPTIAEEALGRSAVEAMGVGRPVIASRIGGLPFTVTDEVTGLLFEPGNSVDLMSKISQLLDSQKLRQSLGRAGRKKFEREYTWKGLLERHYHSLFGPTTVFVA